MIYQVGGSLKKDALSYVSRKADLDLYQALKQGELCYVLNCRQMGKSSLLVRTKNQLEAEGFKCANLDMTMIGSENITPQQWYKGMVAELTRSFQLTKKFNLKQWWQELEDISLLQRLSQFISDLILRQITQEKIVIFVDEIDTILSLPFPVDDFFALIRFCYNQRSLDPEYNRLTFAIFGVATPSDLIQDHTRTSFNIGINIELTGFTLEEAQPLAQGLVVKTANSQAILQAILSWTNGQPFLTQKLCQLIVNFSQDTVTEQLMIPPGNEDFWVESIVKSQIINQWQTNDEPEHLRTIRNRIEGNQQLKGRLLSIYQKVLLSEENNGIILDDSREQIELILSGLVTKKDGFLQVKNRIYQEIFNLAWVNQQLENLRPYSQALESWVKSKQTDESRLLRGKALQDAQTWSKDKSLSDLDYQFLAASETLDRREMEKILELERSKAVKSQLIEQKKTAKLQKLLLTAITMAFLIAVGLSFLTFGQYQKAVNEAQQAMISEIKALASYSESAFTSHLYLEALLNAIKAKEKLLKLNSNNSELNTLTKNTLRQAVYGTHELNRLLGHGVGLFWDVAFSPDNNLIVTASKNQVWLWQKNGKLINTFSGHNSNVLAVAFSPIKSPLKEEIIASGSSDRTVKLWSLNGKELKTILVNSEVQDLVFSPNGQILAIALNNGKVGLWNFKTNQLTTFQAHQVTTAKIAFHPDGQKLATASLDGTARLWNLEGKLLTDFNQEQDNIQVLDFSPDGKILATGGHNPEIQLWTIEGKKIKTIPVQYELLDLKFSPDGNKIATASWEKVVQIWSINSPEKETIEGHQAAIWAIAWSPDGNLLATASWDNSVKLWALESPLVKILRGHDSNFRQSIFSRDGKMIATTSWDQTINLWSRDGKFLKKLTGHTNGITSIAFTPDSKFFATGSWDNTVKIWQSDGQLITTLKGHTAGVEAVAFSPDGKTLVSCGYDQNIIIWQRHNREFKLQKILTGHTEAVIGVAFSPDGKLIASASHDQTVKIWNLQGKNLMTLKGHQGEVYHVSFSPDGQLIASTSDDQTVKLWHRNGKLFKTLTGSSAKFDQVTFSPDGKMIAAGSWDDTIKIWDRNGQELITLYHHLAPVRSVAFSPDSKILISAGDDRTAILWDLSKIFSLNELNYGCNWIRDYLTNNAEVEESDRGLCN